MVRTEKRNILQVVLISVLGVVSVYANECGDHSWEWTNHCYSFLAVKKSRDDASSICRQEGGYLVVLNSKEEEDFVTEQLLRNENMFGDHEDFSYIEHEEDALLEARGRLQREYCKHLNNGTLQQSSLNVLAQNETPLESPRRALLSTPAGFFIRPSLIPRAGLGAWSFGLVPRLTVLGEYEGEALENPRDFTYCWQTESGSRPLYIDGRDEGRSNWLRYVNCARDSREKNTDTFNCRDRKFYYTTKDVQPDSELLVWYGYFNYTIWNIKSSLIN
uniref:PR domain zinc finger protein 2-like n=1 Tax=Crassostrea virginica TaxID=6565 RepID=A0A8B8DYM1_CRAVI|nr:PR domain zinc finger protein 2-like [Crassostrea virginica]